MTCPWRITNWAKMCDSPSTGPAVVSEIQAANTNTAGTAERRLTPGLLTPSYLLLCRRRDGKRCQNQRRHRQVDIGSRCVSHMRSLTARREIRLTHCSITPPLYRWTHLSWFRLPAQQKAMAHTGAHVNSHDVAARVDPVRSGTTSAREIKCSETATA